MNDFKQLVQKEWEDFAKKEHYPNIMLLGQTGCGKSTLINTVFGKNVAYVSETGRGTDGFKVYHGEDIGRTVNLIDSRGYEMGSEDSLKKYISDLQNWLKEHRSTSDTVHLIWYCVQCVNSRFQEYDERVIESLFSEPTLCDKVAIIVTKCDQDDDNRTDAKAIRDAVLEDLTKPIEVFEVSNDAAFRSELEELIEWSSKHIDNEDIRRMFIASQMVSLNAKKKKAASIIACSITAAAATGAIPIPGPDAPILTAEQVAMSAAIISCYGLNMAKGVVTSLVGDVLVSNLGKILVGSLLKLIPGVGSAINAFVAAIITGALGFAISEICYNSCKQIANGEQISLIDELDIKSIKNIMTSFLKQNNKKSLEEIEAIIEAEAEESENGN